MVTIRLSLGYDSEAKRYQQHWEVFHGNHQDAEKRLTELRHQYDTGSLLKPAGKVTVGEYLERWVRDYVKPNLSPRSFERYADVIRRYLVPAFGIEAINQLKPEHLQRQYTEWLNKGLSPRTVRYHHAVIHRALKIAVKWGLAGRNVADGVEIPHTNHTDMQTWGELELSQFLESVKNSKYYPLFYTALFTGMRRGELLALRWQDVDFIYSQIYVNRTLHQLKDGTYVYTQPKSEKSRRTIAMPPSLFLVLESYRKAKEVECNLLGITLKDSDLVFNTLGKPWRPNTITRAWAVLAARAGKRIRLHDARHTHASLMLKQGIHPKIVQERLGHASIQMTLDTYSHVVPGIQEAAAMSFDKLFNRDKSRELEYSERNEE
jgi:integrase